MSKFIWISAFLVVILLVLYFSRSLFAPIEKYKTVDNDSFSQIMADTSNVVVLDVRTFDEFNEGHLKDALLIDVKKDSFLIEACRLLGKDKTIAVYCRSGRRSAKAASMLSAEGYNVVNLKNGITGWAKSNREIVR